jgi:hypothetical protein
MAALCQSLLCLREASRAALIVVHLVRKSIGRYEIGSESVDFLVFFFHSAAFAGLLHAS